MRLWSRASSRASSRLGRTAGAAASAATAKQDLLGVREIAAATAQQDRQVVEDVGSLLVDAVVGLLACGARDLLRLLHDLLADERRVVEQLDGVGALGTLALAVDQRALEVGQRLVRRADVRLAVVEARALARVARGPGRLDEGEHGVAVAVHAQGPDLLHVAGRRALVPELVAAAAPEMQLAGLAGAFDRLGVRVREGED